MVHEPDHYLSYEVDDEPDAEVPDQIGNRSASEGWPTVSGWRGCAQVQTPMPAQGPQIAKLMPRLAWMLTNSV